MTKLPDGWEEKKLGDVVDAQRGISWSKDQEHGERIADAIPVVGITNIQENLDLRNLKYLTNITAKQTQKCLAKKDWSLMVGSNGNADRVGNCIYIAEDQEFLFASFLLGLCAKDKSEILGKYIYYILCSKPIQGAITNSVSGSTGLKNISLTMLRNEHIYIPPYDEQEKIAEILGSVDEAIEKTQSVIDQTARTKKALMTSLLTKGIPGRHTKFKLSPLGDIPDSWKTVELKDICEKITDGTHQSVKFDENGTVPFLYVSCIRNGKIYFDKAGKVSKETHLEISKGREVTKGIILYTAVGSYGHAVSIKEDYDLSFQRHIAYIRPNLKMVMSEYIECFLNSPLGIKQANKIALGNAQKSITLRDLAKFKITYPTYEEQQAIIKSFASFSQVQMFDLEKLTQLKKLKSSLMQVLLTGKVRVPSAITYQHQNNKEVVNG